MRWTLLLAAILGVTAALAQEERPVIKAKDPSTVTVYGSVDKVPEDKRAVKSTEGAKGVGQKVRRALSAVSNGSLKFASWMLGVGDDVPRASEKAESRR